MIEPSPFDHSATSVFRTLDWRWQRAEWRLGRPRARLFEPDDEMTKRLVQYRRKSAVQATRSQGGVPRGFEDVAAAVAIRLAGGPRALELEARILAQQPMAEIAERLDVEVGTVVAYEATFFCVLDRVHARDWILGRAIHGGRFGDAPPPEYAVLLKLLAFTGGIFVLEAALPELIHGFQDDAGPIDLSTSEGRNRQALRLTLQTWLLPFNPQWDARVFGPMYLDQIERTNGGVTKTVSSKSIEILEQHFSRADQPAPTLAPDAADQPHAQPQRRKNIA